MIAAYCMSAVLTLAAEAGQAPTPRGITGSMTITHTGDPLQATLEQSLTSPLLVRVTDLTPGAGGGEHRYRVDYIGVVAGTFDLRALINHRDGTPATELAPMNVTIVSELPAKFGTDLFSVSAEPTFVSSHYRLVIGAIAAVWLAIPATVFTRRMIRNRPAPLPPPPGPAPTLADQLRPLVEAAMRQGLSIKDQARLELLLMAFWSERRDFAALAPAQAIERLRVDPEAGTLLLAVEQWLHARNDGSPRPGGDLSQLLDPYRSHAPIESAEAAR